MRGALGALAAGGALLLAAPVARAQQATFYLDRLYMAGAPEDAIGLWRPQMGAKTRFYGQAGLGFVLHNRALGFTRSCAPRVSSCFAKSVAASGKSWAMRQR